MLGGTKLVDQVNFTRIARSLTFLGFFYNVLTKCGQEINSSHVHIIDAVSHRNALWSLAVTCSSLYVKFLKLMDSPSVFYLKNNSHRKKNTCKNDSHITVIITILSLLQHIWGGPKLVKSICNSCLFFLSGLQDDRHNRCRVRSSPSARTWIDLDKI